MQRNQLEWESAHKVVVEEGVDFDRKIAVVL